MQRSGTRALLQFMSHLGCGQQRRQPRTIGRSCSFAGTAHDRHRRTPARHDTCGNPPRSRRALPLGSGIGYGSNIMATAGRKVHAYDKSADAISFGEQHWDHPNITWIALPLEGYSKIISDWAVCFEVIEHLENPLKLLQMFDY